MMKTVKSDNQPAVVGMVTATATALLLLIQQWQHR